MATLKVTNADPVILMKKMNGESERISVTAPIINLNGATGDSLLAQQRRVLDAIKELNRAICEAAPHGRDFQTDHTGTKYDAARAEFMRELEFINEMEVRHEEIVARIFNQINGRG